MNEQNTTDMPVYNLDAERVTLREKISAGIKSVCFSNLIRGQIQDKTLLGLRVDRFASLIEHFHPEMAQRIRKQGTYTLVYNVSVVNEQRQADHIPFGNNSIAVFTADSDEGILIEIPYVQSVTNFRQGEPVDVLSFIAGINAELTDFGFKV